MNAPLNRSKRLRTILVLAVLCLSTVPAKAFAYAGLGPLVPMIGNGIVLLFIGSITVLGVIAYPLKVVFRKLSKRGGPKEVSKT
jgi:hypothetical protein